MTGKDVLALRTRLGVSQQRLAELLKVSIRSVSRWESGASPVSSLAAQQIRRYMADNGIDVPTTTGLPSATRRGER